MDEGKTQEEGGTRDENHILSEVPRQGRSGGANSAVCLYFKGLDQGFSRKDYLKIFRQSGKVVGVHFLIMRQENDFFGYAGGGFVQYADPRGASLALREVAHKANQEAASNNAFHIERSSREFDVTWFERKHAARNLKGADIARGGNLNTFAPRVTCVEDDEYFNAVGDQIKSWAVSPLRWDCNEGIRYEGPRSGSGVARGCYQGTEEVTRHQAARDVRRAQRRTSSRG